MGNMSYCRFQNTLSDLRECYEAMDEEGLSAGEQQAKERLIQVCADIHHDYGEDDD